jgi:hypothetical protein
MISSGVSGTCGVMALSGTMPVGQKFTMAGALVVGFMAASA